MATLYLTEQGTWVQKENQRFIIQVSKTQKLEVLMREVEKIMVFGNIQLTTPAINACLKNQIMVLFLNQSGMYNGHLWSLESTNINHEIVQIQKQNNSGFQLNISKAIVYGKLMNSKRLLMRINRKRKISEVDKAIAGINSDINSLELVYNLDQLRGYEGVGAARYFPAFGHLITNPEFGFSLRNRQPPTDPVNSLLSFGYTLLFNNVLSLIITEGLSPYLGNFHYGERSKTYLAFDLMEEFRSLIVDPLVLKMINKPFLSKKDFETSESNGGVYLTGLGRKTFLTHFENRLNETVSHEDLQSSISYRQAIHLQIRRYKKSLLSDVSYEPFVRDI
ncbi:CRISPR-associated endonuclease Cas1 [Crocosphaera sp. XPORK-15E]|uniref:CRISPR-associated endonuclease Cas1 n=1 Tax=Crocosphaera sp. XPORK-15E TaxID=3110247 RepID=UPI002B20F9E9|nr:CRISPR-associated endonuclease Cas1 [Crocosphaera sp. XPORK-15E]MEA5537321.1 CRISPR-associated endonuclease Cas1 [Crocosphaera sp. XPORK-15E]